MNNQNFNQGGGFPIKTQTLDEMQKAWSLLNVLGDLAGNFSIISGCIVTGATVSNGAVFINGEVFEFRGGQLGSTVIIVTEVTPKEFKDGTDKDVLYIRYVTFGIGVGSFAWANFKRPKTTIELTEDVAAIETELIKKVDTTIIQVLIDRIEDLEARPLFTNPIKNKGYFTLGDISSLQPVGVSLPIFGDCVSAIIAPHIDAGNTYVDVTFTNAMPSVNYKVNLMVESLGLISSDNDAGNPVFKIIANNKFKIGLYEADQSTQSLRIHFEISNL